MSTFNVTAQDTVPATGIAHAYKSPLVVTAGSKAKSKGLLVLNSTRNVVVTAGSRAASASQASAPVVNRVAAVTSGSAALSSGLLHVASTRNVVVTASNRAAASSSLLLDSSRTYAVTAGSKAGSSTFADVALTRIAIVTAGSTSASSSSSSVRKTVSVTGSSVAAAGGGSASNKQFSTSFTSTAFATSFAHAGKTAAVTAGSTAASHSSSSAGGVKVVTATSTASSSGVAHGLVAAHLCFSTASSSGVCSSSIVLADGTTIPGGDANAGLTQVLMQGISGDYPFSWCEMPGGLYLGANGIDPMVRFDPVAGTIVPAGCLPPTAAIALGGTGVGTITGERVAYQRFIDGNGNVSNLSPVSNIVVMGREALLDDVQCDPVSGTVTLRSDNHGLVSGEQVVVRGVQGVPIINGTRTITVVDPNNFTLSGVKETQNQWLQGGSWVWGVASVVYSSVPVPTSSQVARRQILRNLEGAFDALYVDIDTTDLVGTSFTSGRDDESLAACEPLPIGDSEGLPFANRAGLPPSHKSKLVAHAGRVFATGDVSYSSGCVAPSVGRQTIQGIGTDWKGSLVGRTLSVSGSDSTLTITGVDVANQIITFTGTLAVADLPFATYAICPARAEKKLVYYSEAGNGEAWPEWNTIGLPDDGDTVVGMFTNASYLYIVLHRHVYRLVFGGVPSQGGAIYPACRRGAVAARCVVQVEDRFFMLDEQGVHSYDDDQNDKHVSTQIQTLWHSDGTSADMQIDWASDRSRWHGAYDPVRETVRWFVNMVGDTDLTRAICYHHRLDRWWIEEYPVAITSSATLSLPYRRCVVGTEVRRILALNETPLDIVPNTGTLRGVVTSATSSTLTDSLAAFADNLAGVPVSIVDGTGKGQQGIISSNTANTLTMLQLWGATPDGTSVYQVGGVNWQWRSGWFQISSDQSGNPRDVAVVFKPVGTNTTFDMALYYDHADSPRSWSYDNSDDGVTVIAGSPYISVDMTRTVRPGWAVKRTEGHQDLYAYGDLHQSLQLSGVQGGENVRVNHVFMGGVESNGAYAPGGPPSV